MSGEPWTSRTKAEKELKSYGSGRVESTPSAHSRPPRDVGVLEIREERLIEAADLVEHPRAVQRRATTDAEHLRRLPLAFVDGSTEQPIGGHAELIDLDSGRVDDARAGSKSQLGRNRPGRVVGSRCRKQLSKRPPFHRNVVVEQCDPLAARTLDAAHDCRREANVLLDHQQPGLGKAVADEIRRLVARSVVHDQELRVLVEIRRRLRDRAEAIEQKPRSPERHDDDRENRAVVSCGFLTSGTYRRTPAR